MQQHQWGRRAMLDKWGLRGPATWLKAITFQAAGAAAATESAYLNSNFRSHFGSSLPSLSTHSVWAVPQLLALEAKSASDEMDPDI